ncbi:helix-turn-helix domain-containing protein [Ulvibacterium sp.]|uniref:helix-turn-helix domain-containing protein n=1 Tax=Ulvibacterium sp. TaxID=2665914 RepID=UPI003BAC5DDA
MERIRSYNRISDLLKSEDLGNEVSQDSDFTINRLEEVHPKPIKSPTFRANYYSFVLLRKGNTSYSIDNRTFPTKERTLYFTNPGHLKSFHIKETSYGFLITVSENFLKEHIHRDVFEEFSFLLTEIVPPCYLDEERFEELCAVAEQIMAEKQKETLLNHKIVSSFFLVFLLKLKEYLLKDRGFKMEYDRDSEIVNRFKKDLEKHFRKLLGDFRGQKEIPQVQYFSMQQQLNPSYFSTVIKTKTGRTANQWIQEKILSEAKALLSHSTNPVKEIAYGLGFQEATHFSKFFKKHVGKSPISYRKDP